MVGAGNRFPSIRRRGSSDKESGEIREALATGLAWRPEVSPASAVTRSPKETNAEERRLHGADRRGAEGATSRLARHGAMPYALPLRRRRSASGYGGIAA